jgi:putative cardiolipin synthase
VAGGLNLRILLIIVVIVVGLAIASTIAVYSYGRFAERALGPPSYALPPGTNTVLDQGAADLLQREGGKNGLAMVPNGFDAFAARVFTARAAGRSLDLMYYIWEPDLTGILLADEVLKAADHGVRVRMLFDDFTTHGAVTPYLALDSHPNIEVRMFNPTRARENALRRGMEMFLRLFTATRRMHNKAWIADARVAIVGGRNVGDDYFEATELNNFSDLDLVMIGPVVDQAEAVFDRYWNSKVVLPITALIRAHQKPDLEGFRAYVAERVASPEAAPYWERVKETASLTALLSGPDPIHWVEDAEVIADPPEKTLDEDHSNWLIARLTKVLGSATRSLEITSPYFVTGVTGTEGLVDLARTGVAVSVLTNSLAATDAFPSGFSGYANYRPELIKGGVRLRELMPEKQPSFTALAGASKLALHTKAFTVDNQGGFIGSFNFDPRSAALNTEMGVLYSSADLAADVSKLFGEQSAATRAWRVDLDEQGALRWTGEPGGVSETFDHDPDTSPFRRFVVWVLGKLPIEGQL